MKESYDWSAMEGVSTSLDAAMDRDERAERLAELYRKRIRKPNAGAVPRLEREGL